MELLQLEYFCSAAELENFSAAANRHFIPQSAMSITIKRIEKELGTQLFDRIGNRIHLNEAGKQFYIHAKNCITEFRNAKESVRATTEPCGEIRLLILEERLIMAKLIAKFRKLYPKIRFSISHNIYQQANYLFDIRITSSQTFDNNVISSSLMTDYFSLAVSKEHPLSNRKCVNLVELKNEEFAMFPAEHSNHYTIMEACLNVGFIPRVTILCDDPQCLRTYISSGLAIAIVPMKAWTDYIDDSIKLIPLENKNVIRETKIECLKGSYSSVAVNLFYNYCLNTIKNQL